MRYLMLTYFYQANGKIDEGMTVTTRVRTKDWQTASVILDFKDQKVLKASLKDTTIPKDWDRIVGYYYPFYTNIMERLLTENGHHIDAKDKPAPEATVSKQLQELHGLSEEEANAMIAQVKAETDVSAD